MINGDVTQIDLPRGHKSGLRHAIEVLSEVKELNFNFFHSDDVVRHPVVAKVVIAYANWDIKEQEQKQLLRQQKETSSAL